eukprot:6461890-Amphidinium_carterae.1
MAVVPASWANLAELLADVGITGNPDEAGTNAYAVCQLLGASAAQHWRPIAFLSDSFVETMLDNWLSPDGAVPPPMLRGQVQAMVSTAKDAVMALKRPAASAGPTAE